MEKNKKLGILIVLIVVAIFIWMPKGKRKQQVSPERAPISLEEAKPRTTPGQRKRSAFVDWGRRNPFVWPEVAESPSSDPKVAESPSPDLTLSGIIWEKGACYAIINGVIVRTGDKIAGKTIKRIERKKVIVTDGVTDSVLKLK